MPIDTKRYIGRLWGIAKSAELKMNDDSLHEFVFANTGKMSIKELTRSELLHCIRILGNLRQSAIDAEKHTKGNPATARQRKKIFVLTKQLGWNEKRRINGLCRKMFSVASVDWLDWNQCSKLIEALKAMVERGEKDDAGLHDHAGDQRRDNQSQGRTGNE